MGIYSTLEDKWYDLLEGINNYVPILEFTDKIDEKVPSFALFLVLLLVILIAVLGFVFLGVDPKYDVELTVLSPNGNFVDGAIVNLTVACPKGDDQEISLTTSAEGKAKFVSCSELVEVTIDKENYMQFSKILDFTEEKIQKISLTAMPVPQKNVEVRVQNAKREIISSAKLEYICVNGSDSNKQQVKTTQANNTQPSTGFSFNVLSTCTSVQLKATAQKYKESTITLGRDETVKTIILESDLVKGTIIATANSPIGVQAGAVITITDEFESSENLITLSDGSVTKELDEGTYSYTAMVKGLIESGTFEVIGEKTSEVNIYFKELTSDANRQLGLDTTKNVYLKLMDNNSPMMIASANIFFTKGNDTNYFYPLTAKSDGTMGPTPVLDTNGKTFTAVIKSNGYQTKIVPITLKTKAEGPQIVPMIQGGAKLKVKVVDDQNVIQNNIQTVLYNSSFKGYYDKALPTDKNGVTIYSGVSNGTYSITAKTDTDEGTLDGISISGTDKEVTVVLVTGRGAITFNFFDDAGKANPNAMLYLKNSSGGFDAIESAKIVAGKYTTKKLKAGDEVKIIVNDENYLAYESPVYTVKRTSQERSIFLRTQSLLPNTNPTQLILRQVYDSNPITAKESESRKLIAGEKYYFLFDMVLNNDQSGNAIANFYVGPKDKNALDNNTPITITNAYSISDSLVLKSATNKNFFIDVDEQVTKAKQVNVILAEQTGPKVIPIILEITVDVNAKGIAGIYFEPSFNNLQPVLKNSKEFTIGQSFCLGADCPAFLFSNYLIWTKTGVALVNGINPSEIPVGEGVNRIQLGDEYKLKTIVENTTDNQIGDVNLSLSFEKGGADAPILFKINGTDTNLASQIITLNPLSISAAKEFQLDLIKSANSSVKVFQRVEKKSGLNDALVNYKGTTDFVRLDIRNKNDLNISIVATDRINTIYQNASYPLFLVKTVIVDSVTKTKKPVKATWSVTKEGDNLALASGITDENGIQVISFDATNLTAGTKLIFTATDENNSNPAKLEIIITDPFPSQLPDVPECLKVKINGVDISQITLPNYPKVDFDVSSTKSFVIEYPIDDNSCSGEERTIMLSSDVQVLPKQFTIKPGETQTVSLNASATVQTRGGMLGAYPVQIYALSESSFSQIGFFDAIVTDSTNPFQFQQYIFDFRNTDQINTVITNTAFSGRKDNYYPQLDIGTNTVSLSYNKPGNPEVINMKPKVVGSAIEAIVYCFGWGIKIKQSSKCPSCSTGSKIERDDLYFSDEATDICNSIIDNLTDAEATEKPEPDLVYTNPSTPFYSLPIAIQQKIVSEIEGSSVAWTIPTEDAELAALKEKTIHFLEELSAEEDLIDSNAPLTCADLNMTDINGTCYNSDGSYFDTNGDLVDINGDYVIDPDWGSTLDVNTEIQNCSELEEVSNECGSYGYGEFFGIPEATVQHCYDKAYTLGIVPAPTPPEFNECVDSNNPDYCVAGVDEQGLGKVKIISQNQNAELEGIAPGESGIDFIVHTKGWKKSCKIFNWSKCCKTSTITLQPEMYRNIPYAKIQNKVWEKDFNVAPVEGKIYDLGRYEASPVPQWIKEDEIPGLPSGVETIGMQGVGFVAPELYITPDANSGNPKMFASRWDENSPLIEYDASGRIKYQLSNIPNDTRMFLKNGHVYAEYIGKPTIATPDINVTITRVNLLGEQYAIITVRDWISGTEKKEKIFQVKLIGNPTNCYSTDGTPGFTGSEFVPRLLFDWSFDNISYDQCDSLNPDYTYCDATQFTISLFKRLAKINDYKILGKEQDIPKLTGFYAYLVKDNYNSAFLNDFDTYFSSVPFNGIVFNSTETAKGYDQFISQNKLNFKIKTSAGVQERSDLSMGGIYRVEIGFDYINENVNRLLDDASPNAAVTVTLGFVKQANDYNPFYETPFDGEVGKKEGVYSREGYGTSITNNQEIQLNSSGANARTYTGTPFVNVNYSTTTSLAELDKQIVLSYNNATKQLNFYPSQPTPVVMTITSNGGAVNAQYLMTGFDEKTLMQKKWALLSSTIIKNGCLDFEGNKKIFFTDTPVEYDAIQKGEKRVIAWPNGQKKGTLELATTFFTSPVKSSGITMISPVQAQVSSVKLSTTQNVPSLTSASTLILKYLDDQGIKDYDTLKGIFDRVANKQMCMSQNSANQLSIWWNPDYLKKQLTEIDSSGINSC